MTTASNDILSWTNQDPRESQLFNSWGVMYRFQTVVGPNGQSVTTLWRTIRPNKEDRAAKLEWSATGGLGRIVIGKKTMPMQDLARPDTTVRNQRCFSGPDGVMYRWRPSTTSQDIVLVDGNNIVIAFYRPTRPTRYQVGDVYGELHFLRTAGAGTVTHPPIMDYVTVTIMLYRFCAQWNLLAHSDHGSVLSFSMVSSMESSIVYAEDVATFLTQEEAEIIPKLNTGLLELGYDGPYYLQAGFNEELLCQNIVHPEVFLHLDGNLECGDTIMSKILSPIFAPHTTVLYTHSQVYNLLPPSDITRPHDVQDSLQSPVATYQLNSSQQSRAIETSQASQGSSQRSTGRSSQNRGDDSEDQPPSDERDDEQKHPLLEGVKENGTEDAADDYRRRLELQLDVPLMIRAGLGNNGYVHEFGLKTNINVELRRNRDGNCCPEGLTSIKTPWSSIKFPNITISAGETMLYSFSALKVRVEATPKYTECNHLLPTTVGPTADIKRSRDKRKKRTGGFTGGFMKAELKGEQSSEQGTGEELTIPIWSINPHHTKKWRDKNAREVTVDYTYNGFGQVRTQAFDGPQAIFSYEPRQTGRTLRVFIRALWTLETDGLENRFSHIFGRLRDKVAGRDKPLIYANFFHKISFSINLEDLIPVGGDDDILKGNNRRFDEDSFQDGQRVGNCDKPVFEPMPIHITLNGEESSVEIPLRRSVITAIHGGIKEGERQVTSPDPDPFTSAPH